VTLPPSIHRSRVAVENEGAGLASRCCVHLVFLYRLVGFSFWIL
jgi:hypothetical protein